MGDLKKLAEPFDAEDVEWFIGATTKDKTKGMAVAFITNRAVQERLDAVCGPDGWMNEYKTLGERDIYENNEFAKNVLRYGYRIILQRGNVDGLRMELGLAVTDGIADLQ